MTLTNLKTVKITVTVASVKLTSPADHIGLGFGVGQAYPADTLSQGRFPTPHNPEPEQLRSRQGQSAVQMQQQLYMDKPDAVPPASLAGCLLPGSPTDRLCWSLTAGSRWTTVSATDLSRNRVPKVMCVVRDRLGRDCQSLRRISDKQTLARETVSIAAVGK